MERHFPWLANSIIFNGLSSALEKVTLAEITPILELGVK